MTGTSINIGKVTKIVITAITMKVAAITKAASGSSFSLNLHGMFL
jgi:hypothetical protein